MGKIFQFLTDLKQNNNREWFQANAELYHHVKSAHEKLVAEIIIQISAFDNEIGLLKPADCIFRIYRDVRFSKNKDPYKTAIGAFFSRGGKQSRYAGYYLHIEPQNSFIGGGLWQPQTEVLKSVRREIYYNSDEFKAIIHDPDFVKTFGNLWDEKLKKAPKDFPSDFKDIDLLKYKSYVVGHSLTDDFLISNNSVKDLLQIFKLMKPYFDFLNRGIEATKV